MPTLEQLQEKLKKIQAQADVLIARKAQIAVDQIRELMLKHGLTTEDIEEKAKARRAAKGLNGHAAGGKAKAPRAGTGRAKYLNARTGATWTGHGRAPAWIANVKDRTQYLVDGASELKSSARTAIKKAKAGLGGQPKGAQPPKYRDPKSGATWSGRGPAPAWLKSVKDRSKFLIDQSAAVASSAVAKTTQAAGKAKTAATSGAVSKKAAARKVVAKKAATAGKKAAAKKLATKKVAAKKATGKTPVTRSAAKKVPGRKTGARKAAPAAPAAAPQAAAEAVSA